MLNSQIFSGPDSRIEDYESFLPFLPIRTVGFSGKGFENQIKIP